MEQQINTLTTELKEFEENLPKLRKELPIGTYVLIVGTCLLGHFNNYTDALEAGYKEVGMKPFLVKQISQEGEDIQYVYGLQS